MACCLPGFPWHSAANHSYRPSLSVGLLYYILYQYIYICTLTLKAFLPRKIFKFLYLKNVKQGDNIFQIYYKIYNTTNYNDYNKIILL